MPVPPSKNDANFNRMSRGDYLQEGNPQRRRNLPPKIISDSTDISTIFDGAEPVADTVTLCEMGFGKDETFGTSYSPDVWLYNVIDLAAIVGYGFGWGDFGHGDFGHGPAKPTRGNVPSLSISQVVVNGVVIRKVGGTDSVRVDPLTWYYDSGYYLLYVNLGTGRPGTSVVIVSIVFNYADKAVVVDGVFYSPKLDGVAVFRKERDETGHGVIVYGDGEISLLNHDGEFDHLKERFYTFGQPVEIYKGKAGYPKATFKKLNKTFLKTISIDETIAKFGLADDLEKFTRKLPLRQFGTSAYPYLKAGNIGKWIPLIFGTCLNVPCICTNDDQTTPPSYSFKVADVTDYPSGIAAINTVYVDGVAKTATKNLTTATFTLSTTDYTPGKRVTADVVGVGYANPIDLQQHLFTFYGGATYGSGDFNVQEWDVARVHPLANNVGLYIGERTQIDECVEMIGRSINGDLLIQDDGRITERIYDPSFPSVADISGEEVFGGIEINYSTPYTSIEIRWGKNWAENKYTRSYNGNENEESLKGFYTKYRQLSVDTILTTEADAIELAVALNSYFNYEKAIATMSVPMSKIAREVGDMVQVAYNRLNGQPMLVKKMSIVGIEKDCMQDEIIITGREA